jgi:hypothetical protein
VPVVSQNEYARLRGVAHYAVQKAIKAGRITTLPDGRVDSDVADREWEDNTLARPPRDLGRQHPGDEDPGNFGASQYTKARAVREHYQARIAKIDYEERVGKLVPKDDVQIAAFNKFRQFRDHVLNLPDRLAAMLAAETEAAKVYEILASELRKALNEFADANS